MSCEGGAMYWRMRWTRPGWMGVGDMAGRGVGRGHGRSFWLCGGPQTQDIEEGRLGMYPLPRTVAG